MARALLRHLESSTLSDKVAKSCTEWLTLEEGRAPLAQHTSLFPLPHTPGLICKNDTPLNLNRLLPTRPDSQPFGFCSWIT